MAIIPLKNVVTVNRSSGGVDDWGNPIESDPFDLKCRIEEGSSVTVSRSGGLNSSETVVAEAKILFDKLTDIRYTDEIIFTNELGLTIKRKPISINVKRNLAGKPVLTEVYI